MYQHERDLSSFELWHASIERSQRRRVLAADGRRRVARRKQASTAVTAAMLFSPVITAAGAASAGKGKSEIAQSSPANRAVESKTPRTLDVQLKFGDTGTRVAQLQQLLAINADGIFGPETQSAVKQFQQSKGLKADGIVGQSTWSALLGGSAGAA